MAANAIEVKDVTKVYRLYDKPIDRLKESLSLTHKSYNKDFYALNSLSFTVEKGQTVSRPTKPLKIREAKSDKTYVDLLTGSKYDGAELRAGLILALTGEKDTASLLHLVEE